MWGPNYKVDDDFIEKVQRKETKLVPSPMRKDFMQCLGLPCIIKCQRFQKHQKRLMMMMMIIDDDHYHAWDMIIDI